MAQHTPGPWHTHGNLSQSQSPDWLPVWDNTGLAIATVWAKDNAGLVGSTANANLIAAAPDLLNALEWALEYLDGWPRDNNQRRCRDQAREAIAKAKNVALAKAKNVALAKAAPANAGAAQDEIRRLREINRKLLFSISVLLVVGTITWALCTFAHAQTPKPAPYLMRPPGVVRVLPPPEYDKPYTGKLTIERAETPEDVQRICNLAKPALACAFSYDGTRCKIVIVPTAFIEATGYPEAIVMRHEIGHCNGFPANHAGQRVWDGK